MQCGARQVLADCAEDKCPSGVDPMARDDFSRCFRPAENLWSGPDGSFSVFSFLNLAALCQDRRSRAEQAAAALITVGQQSQETPLSSLCPRSLSQHRKTHAMSV